MSIGRYDDGAIDYHEVERIREALIGRSIISTLSDGIDYDRVLSFVLDDGTVLKAHATYGGCACSNGCFSVEPGNVIKGTITAVEVKQYESNWRDDELTEVTPGRVWSGSAIIRVFVYAELGEQLLIESEGEDNGYYGWGFWLSVHKPEPDISETRLK